MAPDDGTDALFPLELTSGIRLTGWSRGLAPSPEARSKDLIGATIKPRTALLLHGFPEAAFAWRPVVDLLPHHVRAIMPNLRGYAGSSAPADVRDYRPRHLVDDVVRLIEKISGPGGEPIDLLVAHDWGGAVAWNVAAQRPDLLRRLLILNAPHPATFLRELRHNPQQQAGSAYMNFLCRPDAATLLAQDDFRRLWPFFTNMGADDPNHPGGGWLTETLKDQYRAVWRAGLDGALNWYRASPLRPSDGPQAPIHRVELPDEAVTVRVPTTVLWGEADTALPPGLINGLDRWVPKLDLIRVPGATHWIAHEQPGLVAATIERLLGA